MAVLPVLMGRQSARRDFLISHPEDVYFSVCVSVCDEHIWGLSAAEELEFDHYESGQAKKGIMDNQKSLKNCSYISSTSGSHQVFAYLLSLICSLQLKMKMDQNIFMWVICPRQFQLSLT